MSDLDRLLAIRRLMANYRAPATGVLPSATAQDRRPQAYREGAGKPTALAEGLSAFMGQQPRYSVMDPQSDEFRRAREIGEQASVAAEFYGALSPFAAASTMASARRAGSLLSPLTVFHGSPHKFSKFDASKIGTGEGAQAYGHGLYMAEAPEVAQYYARMDSPFAAAGTKGPAATIAALAKIDGGSNPVKFLRDNYASQVKQWGKADVDAAIASLESGNLYKVDLPDEQIAKMLDWDKPLSQQPEAVQKLAKEYGLTKNASGTGEAKGSYIYQTIANRMAQPPFNEKSPYSSGAPIASDKLKELGIPGIRYLDQGSRGKGGTSNFVVFPGEESKLRIMEVNGKPVVINEDEFLQGLLGL